MQTEASDAEFEFDCDTAVTPAGPGLYVGTMTDRWSIGPVPNGGYVLSVGMGALRQAMPKPDPLSVTGHFVRPARPGPVAVHVETVKVGRRCATAMARVVQDGEEAVRILATYGTLEAAGGPSHVAGAPPPLPPRSSLSPVPRDPGMTFGQRFELLSTTMRFEPGAARGPAEVSGWIRFADGRRPDVHSLGLVADAFPPACFHVLAPGWVPTLELTVHVRARPASEWLRCMFRTRFLFGGLLEEDGEIWDERGTLVALSRQLAAAPR